MELLRTKDIKEVVKLVGKLQKEDILATNLKIKYGITSKVLDEQQYTKYIWGYFELFAYSDLIREEVRRHVVDGKTYEEVAQEFDSVNINSYRTMVYKETLKLREILTLNPLSKVRNREPLAEGDWSILNEAKKRYPLMRWERNDNFGLDIDFSKGKFNRQVNSGINEDDFDYIIDTVKYASRRYRGLQLSTLPSEYVGYIDFLLTKDESDLSESELERKIDLVDSAMLELGDGV